MFTKITIDGRLTTVFNFSPYAILYKIDTVNFSYRNINKDPLVDEQALIELKQKFPNENYGEPVLTTRDKKGNIITISKNKWQHLSKHFIDVVKILKQVNPYKYAELTCSKDDMAFLIKDILKCGESYLLSQERRLNDDGIDKMLYVFEGINFIVPVHHLTRIAHTLYSKE